MKMIGNCIEPADYVRLRISGADPMSKTKQSAFIVAGTHSGAGKTTIALTLIRAFVRKGLKVQPFKIGPDFIDSAYHTEAAARESINLDIWMTGAAHVSDTFSRFSCDADVALVEGMGALFDGENGTERGSAAAIAKLLGIPVVLIVDIWGMTRSVVPLLQGFMSFDPDLSFAGFVLNRAGSERHAKMIEETLPTALKELCLGYVIRKSSLEIPERHLGLLTPQENSGTKDARLAAWDDAGKGLELDRLLASTVKSEGFGLARVRRRSPKKVRIAVARDDAFCFYYEENLALLEDAGAELCRFSPMSDSVLPDGVAGAYIGGGYPESFAEALNRNSRLGAQLRSLCDSGMPMYAECGGFMYLGRTLAGFEGPPLPMVGVFPVDTVMDNEHLAIRYVAVRTLFDSPLGPSGTEARGQEFHQSRIVSTADCRRLYSVKSSTGEEFDEGMVVNAALGSYVHLHFASNPEIPRHLVETCLYWHRAAER
jgi:cobyrinic acid a,c-diamide synthase